MEGGGVSSKFLFACIAVTILILTHYLGVEEGGVIDPDEVVSNGQYDARIITEGSSFSLLIDTNEPQNGNETLEIDPALPDGIRLFENNWSLGERTLDMFDNKLCHVSMNGGFVCVDNFDDTSSVDWYFPDLNDSIYSAVSVGGNHHCSILKSPTGSDIYCWGSNTHGQLGNHSTFFPDEAVRVARPGGLIWNDLVTGESHSCASTNENSVYCWGMGSLGQIGSGNLSNSVTPSKVNFEATSEILAIEAGQNHNCALFSTNAVECWGWNGWGQIGDGTHEDRASPSRVNLDEEIIIEDLFLGPASSCVLSEKAEVYCWGVNTHNQISDDSDDSIPLPSKLDYSGNIRTPLVGIDRICILSSEGKIVCDAKSNVSLFDLDMDVRQVVFGKYMCFIFDNGGLSCHDWENGAKSEEIDWLIGKSEIPTIFVKGQISGVPLQNYQGLHRVISSEDGNIELEIVISVDFSQDVDRDGWSNIQELECGSDRIDRFSFPLDSDGDHICDYLDEDDDNDGFLDEDDSFPLDPQEWEDDDYDGIGKNSDSFEQWEPTMGVIITLSLLVAMSLAEIRRKS